MRIVQMKRFGGPEVLELAEAPTPGPGPGQVLIRVRTAGVNFADTLMRQNRYAIMPELPSVLGHEVTGTVESLGDGVVPGLRIGQRVAGPLFAENRYFGGYAEFAALDASLVVPLPDELSFEAATALMVQGLTALYLVRQAPPRGKNVLISAAAGGVGSFLVQLARRGGARRVIAAASTSRKLEFARDLGADTTIDYTRPGWVEPLREATSGAGADLIYESAGGDVTPASLEALAPRGQIVVYGALNIQHFSLGVPELLRLIFGNQSLTGFALGPLLTPERLRTAMSELFDLAARELLRVNVGGVFPLADAANAHRALESRGTTGKLVLVA